MKKQIQNVIEKIYINKDYKFFIEKCKSNIRLSQSIIDRASDLECQIIDFNEVNESSKRWCFKFKEYQKGNLEIVYKTILDVSKITQVFYIQHEFSVKNNDENCMSQTLDGFDSQPYTIQQSLIYEEVVKELEEKGYIELSYSEMNEVVWNIDQISNKSVFGSQVTVENLIFHDYLDINELEL